MKDAVPITPKGGSAADVKGAASDAKSGAAAKEKEEVNDPSRSGKGGGIIRIPEGIMEVARKTPSPPGEFMISLHVNKFLSADCFKD